MSRFSMPALLAATVLLGACDSGSGFPEATGKGSVSAINAIVGSPNVNFLIEERSIGSIPYQAASSVASYDDLTYRFNFDNSVAGADEPMRIARRRIDVERDTHYTLLASGSIDAAVINVWESAIRDFADGDTVFQARFAHTSNSMGPVDVYFSSTGAIPAAGESVASLSFGDISEPMDFETGDYVVTLTTSGDPGDILYESVATTTPAQTNLIITPFDGDENNTEPFVVNALTLQGGIIPFRDPDYQPTIQLLHGALDMGISDVYDDEALTSSVVTDHDFTELTARVAIEPGDYQYRYTPAGDTATITLDAQFTIASNLNHRLIAIGSDGNYALITTALNLRSIDSAAKLNLFNTSNNFNFTDIYLVEADAGIDDVLPFFRGFSSRAVNSSLEVEAGTYDFYLTGLDDKEIIAGPLRLEMAIGDVIDMVVFDTVDTAVLEAVVIPTL